MKPFQHDSVTTDRKLLLWHRITLAPGGLATLPLLLLAALVTVYIVLGLLYESLIHPLTILSTLPSAGVGALIALMVFGVDLSLVSFIAIILCL